MVTYHLDNDIIGSQHGWNKVGTYDADGEGTSVR
jgi:hypothetical protein